MSRKTKYQMRAWKKVMDRVGKEHQYRQSWYYQNELDFIGKALAKFDYEFETGRLESLTNFAKVSSEHEIIFN